MDFFEFLERDGPVANGFSIADARPSGEEDLVPYIDEIPRASPISRLALEPLLL
jgi:hypothetical protein